MIYENSFRTFKYVKNMKYVAAMRSEYTLSWWRSGEDQIVVVEYLRSVQKLNKNSFSTVRDGLASSRSPNPAPARGARLAIYTI